MKEERVGDLYALACGLVCGLGNIPAKAALGSISPEIYNLFFFGAAFVIMSVTLVSKKSRREIVRINKKAFGLIFVLAVLFGVALYCMMTALKMIEPATVSFLSRFEVIVTLVLAFFILKERLTIVELAGGLVALAGVFILKFQTTGLISEAATLMIISAVCFGVAEIIVKRHIALIGTIRFIFWRNLFMIGIFTVVTMATGQEIIVPDRRTLISVSYTHLTLPTN